MKNVTQLTKNKLILSKYVGWGNHFFLCDCKNKNYLYIEKDFFYDLGASVKRRTMT